MEIINEEPIKASSRTAKTAMRGPNRVQPFWKNNAQTREISDKNTDTRYAEEQSSQDREKARFWRMAMWIMPIAIGVLICILTLLVGPVAKLEVEIEQLHEEVKMHSETIRVLEKTVERMQVENEQLRRDVEHLRKDKSLN